MSGRCTGWVLKHGPNDRAMRAVLITIADAANADGEHAHPGIATMVEGSLYSRGTVNRVLRHLLADGWIEVEDKGGGRGHSTVYRVLMETASLQRGSVEKPRHLDSETASSQVGSPAETASQPYLAEAPNGLLNGKPLNGAAAAAQPREEVVALCELLRDRMIANDCKSPTVTRSWLDAARLLLDRDERPLAEAAALIRWATEDPFWRANIHSMPTFRDKYDRLRQARQRPTATDQLDGLRQYREATNGQ